MRTARGRREDVRFEKVSAQIEEEILFATKAICERHGGEISVGELALDWNIVSVILLAHSLGMSREELIKLVNDLADEFDPPN